MARRGGRTRPRPPGRVFTPGERPERGSEAASGSVPPPQPRSSIQGRVGFTGRRLEHDWFSVSRLVHKELACTGRVAPNNSSWGGEVGREAIYFLPGEEERGVLVSLALLGRYRRLGHVRIAGLEPNPSAAKPWRGRGAGARRVPAPLPLTSWAARLLFQLRRSIPLPPTALGGETPENLHRRKAPKLR